MNPRLKPAYHPAHDDKLEHERHAERNEPYPYPLPPTPYPLPPTPTPRCAGG